MGGETIVLCVTNGCIRPYKHDGPCDRPDSRGDAVNQEAARATGVDDPVNPKHYKGDLVMRIIEHFGLDDSFPIGNCLKYILRHRDKNGVEDLLKAKWYLERAIAKLQGKLAGPGESVK